MVKASISWLLFFIACVQFSPAEANTKVRFVTENLPPFQIVNNGKVTGGAIVEIMQAVLHSADISAEIEAYPWPRAYKLVQETPNTFIFSMRKNAERVHQFTWVGELYHAKSIVLGLAERTDINITKVSDINLHSIGLVRGDSDIFLLNKYLIHNERHYALSYKELWQMLIKGRIDLIMSTPAVTNQALYDLNLAASDVVIHHTFDDDMASLYLAANLDTQPETVAKIRSALTDLKANGKIQQILDRWNL